MAANDRADYFRQRRQRMRQLTFWLDPKKTDELDETLRHRDESRAAWFRRIVDLEISKGKK